MDEHLEEELYSRIMFVSMSLHHLRRNFINVSVLVGSRCLFLTEHRPHIRSNGRGQLVADTVLVVAAGRTSGGLPDAMLPRSSSPVIFTNYIF